MIFLLNNRSETLSFGAKCWVMKQKNWVFSKYLPWVLYFMSFLSWVFEISKSLTLGNNFWQKSTIKFLRKLSIPCASGSLDGIALWFDLILSSEEPQITISTAPGAYPDCCWDQAIYPLAGVPLVAADKVRTRFALSEKHISLTSCDKAGEEGDRHRLPRHVITEMNDEGLTEVYSKIGSCLSGQGLFEVSAAATFIIDDLRYERNTYFNHFNIQIPRFV